MTRNLLRIFLATTLAAATWLVAPVSAPAASQPSLCPVMTDSITRLYLAFFDRMPDNPGFRHWTEVYSSGEANLAGIAQNFANADEFGDKRFLSNESYVDWLYTQVLERPGSPQHVTYWVQALDTGYPRGSVALAFTESSEYVRKTDTAMPLAGYLRWYPPGTHWYCNIGPLKQTVTPLTGEVWADYYFRNRGDRAVNTGLWTLEADGRRHVQMTAGSLQPNFTDYNWDGSFAGDGSYGHSIEVLAGDRTDWVVVFYPSSLGPERLGWQLD